MQFGSSSTESCKETINIKKPFGPEVCKEVAKDGAILILCFQFSAEPGPNWNNIINYTFVPMWSLGPESVADKDPFRRVVYYHVLRLVLQLKAVWDGLFCC